MNYVLIATMVFAGAAIPVQVAGNEHIREAVKSTPFGIALSFAVGAIFMLALAAFGVLGRAHVNGLTQVPAWAWLSGLISASVVCISVFALPKAGAGAVIAATIFGQLAAAALIDNFGWLGVKHDPLTPAKICGVLLVFVGALIMQRHH